MLFLSFNMFFINGLMFSWLSGVYASVYCAIVLVYFVVDCFF